VRRRNGTRAGGAPLYQHEKKKPHSALNARDVDHDGNCRIGGMWK
jgi:hypothetical protein